MARPGENAPRMKSRTKKASALDAALKLLEQKDYSAAELRGKLTPRGYGDEEIEEALDVLERYGYVVQTGRDVEQLEKMSAEWLRKRSGRMTAGVLRGLEAFLLKKGFEGDLVSAHLQRLADEVTEGSQTDKE